MIDDSFHRYHVKCNIRTMERAKYLNKLLKIHIYCHINIHIRCIERLLFICYIPTFIIYTRLLCGDFLLNKCFSTLLPDFLRNHVLIQSNFAKISIMCGFQNNVSVIVIIYHASTECCIPSHLISNY